jgi:hypothetical protein
MVEDKTSNQRRLQTRFMEERKSLSTNIKTMTSQSNNQYKTTKLSRTWSRHGRRHVNQIIILHIFTRN